MTITQPRRLPSDRPWRGWEYECERGHAIGADRPLTVCPMARCGTELHRVGRGSRATV